MIRSVGRYGVVERSLSHSAIRRRPVAFLVHAKAHLYTQQRQRCSLPLTYTRYYSDVRGTTKVKSTSSEPAPPPVGPPRKHKVELRPAPVRPTPTHQPQPTTTAPSSEPRASAVTAQADKAASTESHGPSGVQTKESFADMARADLRYAHTHGVLAPPPADAGKLGRLWHQAKELFKFYLRGMKLVYTHRVQAYEMLKRAKAGGPPLSRWETRFIARSRSDIKKLVPFVMIVLVIEEIIPLIVLYAPWMLPSTCLLPSQRERIETKRREKQAAVSQAMGVDLRGVLEHAGGAASVALRSLPEGTQLIALCGMLSLSSFGPPPVRARRIERYLKTIVDDDVKLREEGMGTRLTQPEVFEALEERGIVTVGLETEVARRRLTWWLREADASEEGDVVGRRVVLIARSGLGQYT